MVRDVRIAPGAQRQIRDALDWWYQNRKSAPDLLQSELDRAFRLIASQPRIGARSHGKRTRGVRRIHLDRVRYSLYYRATGAVEVLALWHTSRGEGPPMDDPA
ncbi:MAG: type II toxin-antitoxin system RelE/ParE family toxin [Actinomycetota bacterium]